MRLDSQAAGVQGAVACALYHKQTDDTGGEGPRRPAAGDATREAPTSGGDTLDGYAETVRLVDEIVGDARAGERDDALGQESEEFVVAAEGSGPAVRLPVGLAHDLVDAVSLGPACRYLLRTGAAAVDENDIGVLGLQLVEVCDDFAYVARLLATRDGDERSLGEVGGVRAVLSGALEVSRLDYRRCELAGLRDVGAAPRPPDLAGLGTVGLGGGVTELLEGVPAFREVVWPGRS